MVAKDIAIHHDTYNKHTQKTLFSVDSQQQWWRTALQTARVAIAACREHETKCGAYTLLQCVISKHVCNGVVMATDRGSQADCGCCPWRCRSVSAVDWAGARAER